MREHVVSTDELLSKVKGIATPLEELISGLRPDVRPSDQVAYKLGQEFTKAPFDNGPPPWRGETKTWAGE